MEILFRFLDMDLWQDTEPMLRVLCYKDFGSALCFQTVPLAAMLTLDKASHLIISALAGSLPQGGFPQYLSCQDGVVCWCCTDHPAEPGDMRGGLRQARARKAKVEVRGQPLRYSLWAKLPKKNDSLVRHSL